MLAELGAIYAHVPIAMMLVDRERRVRKVNGFATHFAARSAEEMLGLRGGEALRCLHHLDDPEGCGFGPACAECSVRRAVLETFEDKKSRVNVEAWLPFPREGKTEHRCLLISTAFLHLDDEERVLLCAQDITERKRVEMERERLIAAIEQAAEVIVITDLQGNILYVNPAFEEVTGYQADEVKGQNPRILKSGVQDDSFYRGLWQTITRGETWQGRMVNRRKDGSLYTEETTISPVVDSVGRITNFVAVKRDITAEMEMERRLAQAQKMEAIGTLAGGIAHDFNNILSAIIGYTEMAEVDLPEGSRSRQDLREVLKACNRAKDLVSQILAFSRQSEPETKPLRADLIASEALKMLRSSLPSSIKLRRSIKRDIPLVLADPTHFHQIMMNLCTNAAQAIEDEHGTMEVALDAVEVDRESAARIGGLPPGSYVILTVRDTGAGIRPEVRERIFDPYFTTKQMGEGTGLGLALVYGIVKDYGGGITVESEAGKGSTFTVYFPAAGTAEEEKAPPRQVRLPWGRERILLVDDEEAIAKLGEQYLSRLGYEVTTRQSPVEALEMFREDPQRFDLVVTDMTMPDMTGDKLAAEMLAVRPDIPIILCTGYSRRMSAERAREIGVKAFVMKPLTQHELAFTVRKALDVGVVS